MDTPSTYEAFVPKLPAILTTSPPMKIFAILAIAFLGATAFAVTHLILEVANLPAFAMGACYALLAIGMFIVYRWMTYQSKTTLVIDSWGLHCKKGQGWKFPWREIQNWYCVSIPKSPNRVILKIKKDKEYWVPQELTQKAENTIDLYFSLMKFCGPATPYADRLNSVQRILGPLSSTVDVRFEKYYEKIGFMYQKQTGKDLFE